MPDVKTLQEKVLNIKDSGPVAEGSVNLSSKQSHKDLHNEDYIINELRQQSENMTSFKNDIEEHLENKFGLV